MCVCVWVCVCDVWVGVRECVCVCVGREERNTRKNFQITTIQLKLRRYTSKIVHNTYVV